MDATNITKLLAQHLPGRSLPQAFYKDDLVFQADMELLFHREWLFAGHSCEVLNAGDYITYRVGDAEAIIVRGADGIIRAFHNSCRHRGSRICQSTKGSTSKLVCPYHQWTYELDGQLLFAREMGPNFDPSEHGLKPVHCEELAGYIFICFANIAPDFAEFRANTEPYMIPHDLANTKVAHEMSIIEKGNWKLVWENNRECYHCAGSHPSLCRTFSDTPTITGTNQANALPEVLAHYNRCEAIGLPSQFNISPSGQHRVARMPLLGNAESFTMDGKPAVNKPLGQIAHDQIGSMLLFHYPTTWNHLLRDHAVTFQITPLSPQETQVTTKWLVNKDAVEGIDYDLETLTSVWINTNDEDRLLVEQNQLGINSPAYEPGPYAKDHENGVEQFVNWYCSALSQNLTSKILVAAE